MSSKLFKIEIIQPAFDTLLQKFEDSFSSTKPQDKKESNVSKTGNVELNKLNGLLKEIDLLKESKHFSAEHIKWIAVTKKFLKRNFEEKSEYYNTFASLTWTKKGQYMIGGPARPSESFNPQLGIDRVSQEAYLGELEVARGILQAAREEIIEDGVTLKKSENSIKIFPTELINELPDDIKKVCEEFNFNFEAEKPVASMLLLRRLLPLSIVRKFQAGGNEMAIQADGEYLGTKALLGKIGSSIKDKGLYYKILSHKLLTDSSQHSYTFYPRLSDVEGAGIKIRLLLEDIFFKLSQ